MGLQPGVSRTQGSVLWVSISRDLEALGVGRRGLKFNLFRFRYFGDVQCRFERLAFRV